MERFRPQIPARFEQALSLLTDTLNWNCLDHMGIKISQRYANSKMVKRGVFPHKFGEQQISTKFGLSEEPLSIVRARELSELGIFLGNSQAPRSFVA